MATLICLVVNVILKSCTTVEFGSLHTQIDEIEQRKEEEMQKAMKKLEMAQQMQKQVGSVIPGTEFFDHFISHSILWWTANF